MVLNRPLAAVCALVFLTPGAGVLAARFIGGAVSASHASVPEPAILPITPLPPIPVQTDRRGTLASLPSPFRVGVDTTVHEQPRPGEPSVRSSTLPELALTAVMPHARRPIAVINGRPRTIGEEAAPGWTILEIDGESRTIVVAGPGAERVRIRMNSGLSAP